MSLSPECYRKAIGIASVKTSGGASCLVYLNSLTGEMPCGCDGWPLRLHEDFVMTDWDWQGADNFVFPPFNQGFVLADSKKLAEEVARIRGEYLARQA
jgi:hypothetical protein